MNKNNHSDKDEMLDDYTELLERQKMSKPVRGKYYSEKPERAVVKITDDEQVSHVTMTTLEVEVVVTPEGKLTVEVPSSLAPGKYQAALIIEEPVNLPIQTE